MKIKDKIQFDRVFEIVCSMKPLISCHLRAEFVFHDVIITDSSHRKAQVEMCTKMSNENTRKCLMHAEAFIKKMVIITLVNIQV